MTRLLVPLGAFVLACAAIGCSGGRPPIGMGASSPTTVLDSLQAENTRLRSQVRRLRDSLRLYSDVSTGQYARELRVLQDQLNRLTYEVQLLRDGGQTVALLPADSLFESATATLTANGKERLRSVAAQLQTTYPNRVVRVEGHADDVPLSDALKEQFASNWELSSARAASVARHLIDSTRLDRGQFTVVGYGDTRPIATNETASGRRRNRRVRIAVLPRPRSYSRPFETSW